MKRVFAARGQPQRGALRGGHRACTRRLLPDRRRAEHLTGKHPHRAAVKAGALFGTSSRRVGKVAFDFRTRQGPGRGPPSARWRSPRPAGTTFCMIGPPGSGKTLMARCVPTILAGHDLSAEALEVTRIHSVAGCRAGNRFAGGASLPLAPPHRLSRGAGGRRQPTPCPGKCQQGAQRRAVSGRVAGVSAGTCWRRCASRWRTASSPSPASTAQATYPARFMLVCSMNPCPCGHLRQPHSSSAAATPAEIRALSAAASPARCWIASTCTSKWSPFPPGPAGRRSHRGSRPPAIRARVCRPPGNFSVPRYGDHPGGRVRMQRPIGRSARLDARLSPWTTRREQLLDALLRKS